MAKKTKGRTFTVRYERDRDGWWVATVKELQGCHTQGRSIAQARKRIREAMALDMSEAAANAAELDEHIVVDRDLDEELRSVRARRAELEQTARDVQAKTAAVATRLARAGVSRRDVGELLGVSFQRVQQIAKA